MKSLRTAVTICLLLAFFPMMPGASFAADHNDPNAVNSIFADIDVSAADLYDIFGFPSNDTTGGEKVVIALTFASVPKAGVFDTDMLYRLRIDPDPRAARAKDDESLEAMLRYAGAIGHRYLKLKTSEIRVKVGRDGRGTVDFIGFPGGTFTRTVGTNAVETIQTPDGFAVKAFLGGRDDPFFNDLPGFFRSINYAPQFYHVPEAMKDRRELEIPKTLLELEGNKLFNFDPAKPRLGQGVKEDFPAGAPATLKPDRFQKDANGNYRFVYSGKDAQAGKNVNALIFEIPLAFLTRSPKTDRIVNVWGESWVMRAAHKAETISDAAPSGFRAWLRRLFHSHSRFDDELAQYKLVDTDGVPFEDAALSERENERQLGANNAILAPHFVTRFGHLGWGFGPSISALGLGTCFDHDNSPVSVVRYYKLAVEAFPRVRKCLFQDLNMPDDTWNPKHLNIPLKKAVEIFIPNVCAIDMDTTGTWPYGRRPEDQVATRFLSIFLDMKAGCGGKPCNLESLGDQALWDRAPIEPKTPPNPLKNDKDFLSQFPYLAEPW
jgi:hypothetical protein